MFLRFSVSHQIIQTDQLFIIKLWELFKLSLKLYFLCLLSSVYSECGRALKILFSVKYGAIAAELSHQQDGVCCLIIDEVQERMIGIKYRFLYSFII